MTDTDFLYWLQGGLELFPDSVLTAEQVSIVKEHIALVQKLSPNGIHIHAGQVDVLLDVGEGLNETTRLLRTYCGSRLKKLTKAVPTSGLQNRPSNGDWMNRRAC